MRGKRAGAVLVVLGALLLPAGSAAAAETGAGHGGSGDDRFASAGTCVMYAGGTGRYGMRCAGAVRKRNFLELLQGAPPPTCWLRPLGSRDDTPDEPVRSRLQAAALPTSPDGTPPPWPAPEVPPATEPPPPTGTPTGEPSAPTAAPPVEPPPAPTPTTAPVQLWTQVCLDPPVDPRTGVPQGRVTTVTSQVPFSPDDPARPPLWEELTPGQQAFADLADERAGRIVTSDVMTSPSLVPRVRQVVSFSLEDTTPPPPLEKAGVQMRARVLSLSVDPGEPGRAAVTCEGPGTELTRGAPDRTGPRICSFDYHRTSARSDFGAPENVEVRTTATWRIEFSDDDGATWATLRDITQERSTGLRVQEVQTLVVPAP
ncbi:hypothetical protein [Kineococcus rubinsiae]|uniref:hypothetical protein n=1 Tax=Kineococcus rubinsiae TaxID=2609562 RepID=UPI0014322A54|nr:hypothetical protein [Kineococcus rubinsiae]NIZ93243.1 hypothetical protein [Kineococcus rubinsiae]